MTTQQQQQQHKGCLPLSHKALLLSPLQPPTPFTRLQRLGPWRGWPSLPVPVSLLREEVM